VLLLSFLACKKNNSLQPKADPNLEVYICGTYTVFNLYDAANNQYVNVNKAAYWKNGLLVSLADDQNLINSIAQGIVVSQGHVYVVGAYDNKPCYWEDGIRYSLMLDLSKTGIATALAVKDGTLFISGDAEITQGIPYAAFLWVVKSPSDIQQVALAPSNSFVNDMVLDGNLVYVAGKKSYGPCYWLWDGVNLSTNTLNNPNFYNGDLKSILLKEGKVYATGTYDVNGNLQVFSGYWIDNQFQNSGLLASGTLFRDLVFSPSGELFVVGNQKDQPNASYATFWKSSNASPIQCSNEVSSISRIVFNGADFYMCGSNNYRAAYWKNGINPIELTVDAGSTATDIFIVQK
jgi:hypothetical protein